MSEVIEECR